MLLFVNCLAIVGDLECLAIVGDLDPEPDPHVFGTSGSVSISQRYGSEIRMKAFPVAWTSFFDA